MLSVCWPPRELRRHHFSALVLEGVCGRLYTLGPGRVSPEGGPVHGDGSHARSLQCHPPSDLGFDQGAPESWVPSDLCPPCWDGGGPACLCCELLRNAAPTWPRRPQACLLCAVVTVVYSQLLGTQAGAHVLCMSVRARVSWRVCACCVSCWWTRSRPNALPLT